MLYESAWGYGPTELPVLDYGRTSLDALAASGSEFHARGAVRVPRRAVSPGLASAFPFKRIPEFWRCACDPAYSRSMSKYAKSKPAAGSATPVVPNDPQSISFVKGLVARGEAARADAKGNLPRGATHEIVGETETGLPIVVRRRFSGH